MAFSMLLLSIALGATLAAAAGFRAFLPLLALGLVDHYHLLEPYYSLGPSFQWLSSEAAIICLLAATTFEIIADKIPAVDSALDSLMTFVRPATGGVSVFAILSSNEPIFGYVAGIVLAGGATLPIHLGKSMLRLGSHATTGGAGSPVLSVAEDVSSGLAVALALLVPFCAIALGFAALALVVWIWRRRRKIKAT